MEDSQTDFADNSIKWNNRFYRAKTALIGESKKASIEINSEEINNMAYNLTDILIGKKIFVKTAGSQEKRAEILMEQVGKKPYWETRVAQARNYSFKLINRLQTDELSSKVNEVTRKFVYDNISNVLALGAERVDNERLRTNKGMFDNFREEMYSYYSNPRFNSEGEETLNKITRLTEVLQGKALNKYGKRIWKWSDRLKEVDLLTKDIERTTAKEYEEGRIDYFRANKTYLNVKKVIEIGIVKNNWIKQKYRLNETGGEFYQTLSSVSRPWYEMEKVVENKREKEKEYVKTRGSEFLEEIRTGINTIYNLLKRPLLTSMKSLTNIFT